VQKQSEIKVEMVTKLQGEIQAKSNTQEQDKQDIAKYEKIIAELEENNKRLTDRISS